MGQSRVRVSIDSGFGVPGIFSLLCLLLMSLLPLFLAASIFHPRYIFITIGVAALLIVLAPVIAVKNYDIMAPWSFVVVAVVIGVVLRNVYIAFDIEGPRTIDGLFLLGEEPVFFVYPGLLMLGGLAAIGLGYSILLRSPSPQGVSASRLKQYCFRPNRVAITVLLCTVVSVLAMVVYIQSTGGFDAERLSAKRTTVTLLTLTSGDQEYRGLGYLPLLNGFGLLGFLILVAHFAKERRSLRGWRGLLLLLLLLNAVALPVYRSSKSDALWAPILAMVVFHYAGRRIRLPSLAVGILVLAMSLSLLNFARANENLSFASAASSVTGSAMIDALVYNRNMIELPKTAHVINRVPEVLEYQNGSTFLAYLFAPIPRDVWPDKPVIASGPILGREIYGTHVAGVPPGLIAELYWNFGLAGLLMGCVPFGMLLRYVYERFHPVEGASVATILLYSVGAVQLGYDALGNSLGSAVLGAGSRMIQISLLLMLAGSWKRRGVQAGPVDTEALVMSAKVRA